MLGLLTPAEAPSLNSGGINTISNMVQTALLVPTVSGTSSSVSSIGAAGISAIAAIPTSGSGPTLTAAQKAAVLTDSTNGFANIVLNTNGISNNTQNISTVLEQLIAPGAITVVQGCPREQLPHTVHEATSAMGQLPRGGHLRHYR